MRKTKIFFLLCVATLLQPCHSKSIEIGKSLPLESRALNNFRLSSSGAGIGTQEVQYTCYVVEKNSAAVFGGIEIPIVDSAASSPTCFYSKNGGTSLQGYTLSLPNPDVFAKILKYLLEDKNKFKLVFDDGKDSEERARIFVSNIDGATYLLLSRVNQKGKKSGYIDGISKDESALLSSRLGGAFGYYEQFLEYKKHRPAGFGYLDFLRETNSEIYKKDNNLKP
jgi:hypothetical protein